MSKGNMMFGEARKKLGSVVFYVRNGEQVQRKWTASGARKGKDASYPARGQRVAFGAAANEWSVYKYICTRMYRRGKRPTESDYNYFVRQNWQNFPYLTKQLNEVGFASLVPGVYSRGNLGALNLFLSVYRPSDSDKVGYILSSKDVSIAEEILWSGKFNTLLPLLRNAFINAQKVTYLLICQVMTSVNIDGRNIDLPQFYYDSVVIDLYGNNIGVTTSTTIKAFFESRVKTPNTLTLLAGNNGTFCDTTSLLKISDTDGSLTNNKISFCPLVFATDDTAMDCYTTTLYSGNVPLTEQPFAAWYNRRGDEPFEEAAASYGYTTGVMQTHINDSTNKLEASAAEYIDKLRDINPDDADVLSLALADGGLTQMAKPIKELRKIYGTKKDVKAKK